MSSGKRSSGSPWTRTWIQLLRSTRRVRSTSSERRSPPKGISSTTSPFITTVAVRMGTIPQARIATVTSRPPAGSASSSPGMRPSTLTSSRGPLETKAWPARIPSNHPSIDSLPSGVRT